jgi:pimeloyl-ACP methyl ester carboxylesterase
MALCNKRIGRRGVLVKKCIGRRGVLVKKCIGRRGVLVKKWFKSKYFLGKLFKVYIFAELINYLRYRAKLWSLRKYKPEKQPFGEGKHGEKVARLSQLLENVSYLGRDAIRYLLAVFGKKTFMETDTVNSMKDGHIAQLIAAVTYNRLLFITHFSKSELHSLCQRMKTMFSSNTPESAPTKELDPPNKELIQWNLAPFYKPLPVISLLTLGRNFQAWRLGRLGFSETIKTKTGSLWVNDGTTGNLLVLVPGLSAKHYAVAMVENLVSKHNFPQQRLAVYFCDHFEMSTGISCRQLIRTSMPALAEDMASALYSVGKVNFIAHSAGTTLVHLVRQRHPELCNKVVLLDPICLMPQIFSVSNLRNLVWPTNKGCPLVDQNIMPEKYTWKHRFTDWLYCRFVFRDINIMMLIQAQYTPVEFLWMLEEDSTDYYIFLGGRDVVVDNRFCYRKIREKNLYPKATTVYHQRAAHGSIIWGKHYKTHRQDAVKFALST